MNTTIRSTPTALLGGLLAGLCMAGVQAQTIIPQSALQASTTYYTDSIGGGIGTAVLGRNDDGFTAQLPLGFSLNFFGSTYTSFFINNNGNISFNSGISAYVPTGPTGASAPVISPWFSDVDTRGALSDLVYLRTDIANEIIVTWNNVGYYAGHDDKLNSFQLVVRGAGFNIPTGEGSIGFFYKDMPWEVTQTSQVAAVGFGNGSGASEVLQGSTSPGLNAVVANHHIWFDQNLAVVPPPDVPPVIGSIPEPETYALMLAGLGAIGWSVRRRRSS